MLGEVNSFSGVDFDQTLFLSVNIGGTGTPSWDGEMTPRKTIGTVPAAFIAKNLRGTGTINITNTGTQATLNYDGSNSATLAVASNGFTTLTATGAGAGWNLTGGNVGIGTTAPGRALEINDASGNNLRLTYNDSDGSATNYVDLLTTSAGNLQVRPSGFVTEIGGGATRTALRFLEPSGTGTDYAAIQSNANVTTSYTWTLPAADASGCIQSNGSGTLSISACGGGLTIGSTSISSGGANRILYENGSTTLSSSSNFTYDGTTLTVAGNPTSGAQMALTNTGVYTGTGIFNLTANSATTGTLASVTGNGLTTGNLLSLSSNGTAAAASQTGLNISLQGTNGTGGITSYGAQISNAHAGATSTNVALQLAATNGTTANYALLTNGGNVGIGDTSPNSLFTVGSGDLFQINTSGQIGSQQAPVSDYLFSLAGTTGNDNSRIIDIVQSNDSAESTYGMVITSAPTNTTLTGGTSRGHYGQEINLAPTATVDDDAILVLYGSDVEVDLTGITLGDTDTDLVLAAGLGVVGSVAGSPTINSTTGSNGVFLSGEGPMAAVSGGMSLTPTITALNGPGVIDAAGGLFTSSVTPSIGHANLTSTVYGIRVNASGELTTTGTTTHYGGYFTTSGTADTNYGLYATVTGGTTNYAAILTGGNVGIGTTAPGRALEVNDASGNNLRLTYNDSDGSPTNYVDLLTTSGGNLTVVPSGGTASITGIATISSILQVGSATATTYSRLGTGTTNHSGDVNAADDLLVTGGLEVDGNGFFDGNLTVTGTCTGCGAGGATRLDQILAATTNDNDNDNLNNAIDWDWSTLTTQDALTLNATGTGLTSGSIFKATSATTGAVTNGIIQLLASANYSGTGGLLNVTANSTTAGVVAKISGTGLTTGTGLTIAGGSAMTTGGALDINGGSSYNHVNATETGSLAKLTFTDATQGTATSTTNGLLISPTVNVTTGASGTKTINGLSVATTLTACTGGSSCTVKGLNVANVTDIASVTSTGLSIGTGWDTGIEVGSGLAVLGTGSSATGKVTFMNSTNGNTASIQAGTTSGNYTWTLPDADASGCIKSNGSGTLSIASCGDAKSEVFTSNGNYTMPSDARIVIVDAIGGGGSGGGGGRNAGGVVKVGGGGGGGGAWASRTFDTTAISSPVTITVPAAVAGGNGATATGNGTTGAAGANVSFGSLLTAYGGGGGAPGRGLVGFSGGGGGGGTLSVGSSGTTAGGVGGGPNAGVANGGFSNFGGGGGGTNGVGGFSAYGGGGGGGSNNNGAVVGFAGGVSLRGGGGGGAGGGVGTNNVAQAGGAGGGSGVAQVGNSGGGGAAGAINNAGTAGANAASNQTVGSSGGGGGGGGNGTGAQAGGAGGNGGTPGGGGGGGGGGANAGNGGNGGAGGRGQIQVWTIRGAGAADLAESYSTNDPDINVADVVVIDPELSAGVKLATKAYDKNVLGIISTQPNMVMGGDIAPEGVKQVNLALAGRVPVRVSLVNGAIKPGDYLTTSDIPGVAMKATRAGPVIGRALGSFSGDGGMPTGIVLVYVQTGYFNGESLADFAAIDGITVDTGLPVDFGKQVLAKFNLAQQDPNQPPNPLTLNYSDLLADRVAASLEIITPTVRSNSVFTDTISPNSGSSLTFEIGPDGKFILRKLAETGPPGETSENVLPEGTVAGDSTLVSFDALGNAFFAGELTAGTIKISSITGLTELTQTLTDTLTLQQATLTDLASRLAVLETPDSLNLSDPLLTNSLSVAGSLTAANGLFVDWVGSVGSLITFKSDVEFIGRPYFTTDTAGFAKIYEGDRSVDVVFERDYLEQPIVNVSIGYDGMETEGFEDITELIEANKLHQEELANTLFQNEIQFIVINKTTKGFTIILNKPATQDISFSWIALAVNGAKTFSSIKSTPSPVETIIPEDGYSYSEDIPSEDVVNQEEIIPEPTTDSSVNDSSATPPSTETNTPQNSDPPPADSGETEQAPT